MSIREHFLTKLYHLTNRELTPIDRYEAGNELNLPKQETDAIVNELSDRGRISKMVGTKIMLSLNEKKILDGEWRRVNE